MVLTDLNGVVVLTAMVGQAPTGSAPPSVPGAVVPGGKASEGAGTLAPGPTGPAGGGGGQPTTFPPILWIIVIGMMVMILMTSRTGRKQKKEREAMLSSLKRNDRVQTAGGIIGTVIELTDTEMVLRVDETSNTRIRFARSAIQQILREGKDSGRLAAVEAKPSPEAASAR